MHYSNYNPEYPLSQEFESLKKSAEKLLNLLSKLFKKRWFEENLSDYTSLKGVADYIYSNDFLKEIESFLSTLEVVLEVNIMNQPKNKYSDKYTPNIYTEEKYINLEQRLKKLFNFRYIPEEELGKIKWSIYYSENCSRELLISIKAKIKERTEGRNVNYLEVEDAMRLSGLKESLEEIIGLDYRISLLKGLDYVVRNFYTKNSKTELIGKFLRKRDFYLRNSKNKKFKRNWFTAKGRKKRADKLYAQTMKFISTVEDYNSFFITYSPSLFMKKENLTKVVKNAIDYVSKYLRQKNISHFILSVADVSEKDIANFNFHYHINLLVSSAELEKLEKEIKEKKNGKGKPQKGFNEVLATFIKKLLNEPIEKADKKTLNDGREELLVFSESKLVYLRISNSQIERMAYEKEDSDAQLQNRDVRYTLNKLYPMGEESNKRDSKKSSGTNDANTKLQNRDAQCVLGRVYSATKKNKFSQVMRIFKIFVGIEEGIFDGEYIRPRIYLSDSFKKKEESAESSNESNQVKKKKIKRNPIQSNLRIFTVDKPLIKISPQVKLLFLYARAPPILHTPMI